MSLTGSCFCGAVGYTIDGRVFAARSCHCSRCRKAFSAQASAYAEVEDGAFRFTRGEELVSRYVGEHGAGKAFCSRCGSMLCGIVDERVHGIALGLLDDAPEGLVLDQHLFVGSKAPWEVLPEGVTTWEGLPDRPLR